MTGVVPLALIASTFSKAVARVDRLVTYTVSLAGLTALVVGVYAVVVLALGRTPQGSERTLLLLSMGAAALAALIWLPARRWLNDTVNRVVYGERVSPDESLRTWGSRLTRAIPMDELLLQLCESLRKTMNLVSAEVWTGADGHYEWATGVPHRAPAPLLVGEKERPVVARAGVSGGRWLEIWLPDILGPHPSAAMRVAPLAHQGELLGLIVGRRSDDGDAFTEEDDRVLAELARQVGLALHNVQLDSALQASLAELRLANEELRASRARIVAAGDAERRKLERNLHDGAQQHLVALAVKLRLAKDAVEDDPPGAIEMMDELRGDIQDAIQELRALAHGIFPPLLVSGGLTEALPAAAGRAALPTTADVGGLPALPLRGRGRRLLLLPRGAAERRQARRRRRQGQAPGLGGRGRAPLRGLRQRRRLHAVRRRVRLARPRLRQHGRPPGRHRRLRRRPVQPRPRHDDLRPHPPARVAGGSAAGRRRVGAAAGRPGSVLVRKLPLSAADPATRTGWWRVGLPDRARSGAPFVVPIR